MKLNEQIRNLLNTFSKIDSITEGKGHLDHPEDLIMTDGTAGAKRALDGILATAKNPKAITIKWDGYPALIFGRGTNGKFTIIDKHMFNKTDGTGRQIFSPQDFINYDKARGVNRAELHELITNIWPGLQKASQGSKGYYWGDSLFGRPLKDEKGIFKFKANPNGIAYTVDADSDIGKLLAGKKAGIAVHQYLSPDSLSTDQAQSLDGGIGQLKNNSDVAIVPSAMPIVPNIKVDPGLVKEAKSAIAKYGSVVDKMIDTAPQAKAAFTSLFTTYINKKIVAGDLNNMAEGFMDFIENRNLTPSMKKKLTDHFNANKDAIVGAFTIWVSLYNLKNSIVQQLAQQAEQSPVKGYLQSGQQSQEGFVSQGLKFVDRMGFSRQNLGAQR